MTPRARRLLALLAALAALVFLVLPFWGWILFALWTSAIVEPIVEPVVGFVHGRRRAAAVLTLAILLVVLVPLALSVIPLASDAAVLVRRLALTGDGRRMLEGLGSGDLLQDGGARAVTVLRSVAGATTSMFVGAIVFLVSAYYRIAHGAEVHAWLAQHVPLDRAYFERLEAVFWETGRGLFIGIGGAALAQAIVSTILYVLVGAPHAFVLGVLTFFAAVVPALGTAIVWIPVAGGLALTGHHGAGLAVAIVGLAVVGTIDNVVKPLLTRYGKLDVPAPLLFVALLGGILIVGPPGLLLAPLVVRAAKELILLASESPAP